jgi:tetraacyldisaccharide 4'-kinase
MRVEGKIFESIKQSEIKREVGYFAGKDLVAIAGIGNPERFFNKLTELGLEFTQHVFPDHFAFTAQDLSQFSGKTILMTEKDAVKCQAIEINDAWCLPITAEVSSPTKESLVETIIKKLRI